MRTVYKLLSLFVLGTFVATAWGQVDTETAQKKLLAKRAAEADAYRKLAEAVKGVQIDSQTYVRDFVAESDEIQAALDEFIKGVRLGEPRWYPDLSCEVPAEVTVAKVVETLKEIHTKHYKGDHIQSKDFEQINKKIEKNVIKVVGMGAPREDLPPDLPAGVVEQIGAAPTPPQPFIPPLWSKVGPQGRMMAVRAARTDAMRKLVERIRGLRITSNTVVRDFVAESDEIRTITSGTLVGMTEERIYYHDDEPIVEVTMSVPVESVITTIKEMQSKSVRGHDVKGSDITELSKRIKTRKFEATGMGVPPAQIIKRYEAKAEVDYPDWAVGPIVMTGEAVSPPDQVGTAQGKLMAIRAAEVDAKRKLAEYIYGLKIKSETLVRDFVAEHDEVRAYMDAILSGAAVQQAEYDGETAKATVVIPGIQVYGALNERMKSNEGQ